MTRKSIESTLNKVNSTQTARTIRREVLSSPNHGSLGYELMLETQLGLPCQEYCQATATLW